MKKEKHSSNDESTMSFDAWASAVEKDQGVTLEEACEAMGIDPQELGKWEKSGKVPGNAVKFLRGLEGKIQEVIDDAP